MWVPLRKLDMKEKNPLDYKHDNSSLNYTNSDFGASFKAASYAIKEPTSAFNPITKPAHYNHNAHGIECITAIEASMSREEFLGYLKGNVEKYLWRYSYKGKPKEDLEKSKWYLDKLIEKIDEKSKL